MKRHSFATGALAIDYTLAPGIGFTIHEVRCCLSAAGGAGDLTITVTAITGAVYNHVLVTQDMTAVVDLRYLPAQPFELLPGDEILIEWANANVRTYGLEVLWTPS